MKVTIFHHSSFQGSTWATPFHVRALLGHTTTRHITTDFEDLEGKWIANKMGCGIGIRRMGPIE